MSGTASTQQPVTDITAPNAEQRKMYAQIGHALVTATERSVRYPCPLCNDPLHKLSSCPRWRVKENRGGDVS